MYKKIFVKKTALSFKTRPPWQKKRLEFETNIPRLGKNELSRMTETTHTAKRDPALKVKAWEIGWVFIFLMFFLSEEEIAWKAYL